MSNHVSHAALPYPIKGCRYSILIPYLDADGDPTDPTTPDTERSIDAAAFADCTEEVTTISGTGTGMGYITLTGDEMNGSLIAVAAKVASGPKATLAMLQPRVLPVLRSGTAQAGASGTITLDASASAVDDYYNGCIVRTTGGTGGGGGSGSLGNQARVITDYVGSTKVATVVPNWETTPDNTTTFEVLQTAEWATRLADVRLWKGTAPNDLVDGRVSTLPGLIRTATIAGTNPGSVTLDASASATDDLYNGQLLFIVSGTGAGQARLITDYDGTTKVAVIKPNWTTNPAGAVFAILPGAGVLAIITDAIDAASTAADSINASALAADAATEIATAVWASATRTLTALGFVLNAGDLAADTIGASELAADAVTEIQSGLATAAALATVASYIDTEIADIQSRLPAALVGGRMDSSVGAMAANVLTAAAIATAAIDADALAADAVQEIVDAVFSQLMVDYDGVADFRTLYGAVSALVNKREIDGTDLVVYEGDDTTELERSPLTTDPTQEPIVSVDPT